MLEIVVMRIINASKTKLIPIAWSFIASLIAIVPPLLKPGFPPNHEDDTFVLRTMVHAKHFQFGNWYQFGQRVTILAWDHLSQACTTACSTWSQESSTQ